MFIAYCRRVRFDDARDNVTFNQLRACAKVRLPNGMDEINQPLNEILKHGDLGCKLTCTLQFIEKTKLLEHLYRYVMKHCHHFCLDCRGL